MKTALLALLAGVALMAPGEALAHAGGGRRHYHQNRHHHHGHGRGNPNKPWARRQCHYHPGKGFWHCHPRRRGHGEPMKGETVPNFGVHFIIPFQ